MEGKPEIPNYDPPDYFTAMGGAEAPSPAPVPEMGNTPIVFAEEVGGEVGRLTNRIDFSTKIGRLTNEIHLESIKTALAAGFRAGANGRVLEEFLSETNPWSMDPREDKVAKANRWSMDPREDKVAKTKGERPKKVSFPFPRNDPELANKPFDPEFCNARLWNSGFGCQCNRSVDTDGLCTQHAKVYDKSIENGGTDLSHGRYNDDRPTHCLAHAPFDREHPWRDLRAEKKSSGKKEKKEKKEKKKHTKSGYKKKSKKPKPKKKTQKPKKKTKPKSK